MIVTRVDKTQLKMIAAQLDSSLAEIERRAGMSQGSIYGVHRKDVRLSTIDQLTDAIMALIAERGNSVHRDLIGVERDAVWTRLLTVKVSQSKGR